MTIPTGSTDPKKQPQKSETSNETANVVNNFDPPPPYEATSCSKLWSFFRRSTQPARCQTTCCPSNSECCPQSKCCSGATTFSTYSASEMVIDREIGNNYYFADIRKFGKVIYYKGILDSGQLNWLKFGFSAPNLIRPLGAVIQDCQSTKGLILEHMGGGTLKDVLFDRTIRFNEQMIISWTTQVARGLMYLHERSIIHNNIRPETMYLTDDCAILKLAIEKEDKADELKLGVVEYRREMDLYQDKEVLKRLDSHGLAISTWQMYHRRPPFQNVVDYALPDDDAMRALRIHKKINAIQDPMRPEFGESFKNCQLRPFCEKYWSIRVTSPWGRPQKNDSAEMVRELEELCTKNRMVPGEVRLLSTSNQ